MKTKYDVWDESHVDRLSRFWGDPRERRGRHADVQKKISEIIDYKSILDAGCGLGHLFEFLKDSDFDYIGFDYSPHMIEQARKFYPEYADLFQVADVYNTSEIFEPRETVTAVDLIIHVPNQLGALEELWDCTEKELIITLKPADKSTVAKQTGHRFPWGSFSTPKNRELIVNWNSRKEIYKMFDMLGDNYVIEHYYDPRTTIYKLVRQ